MKSNVKLIESALMFYVKVNFKSQQEVNIKELKKKIITINKNLLLESGKKQSPRQLNLM